MLVFVAAAGLIVGSFLNALLFRFNTGKSVMRGRSACTHCGHLLRALDLVPLLSFVFLRGRCRYCHSRISWQYPLVEATAALLAVLVFLEHQEPLWFGYWFLVWMVLLFVFVYDVRHKIIPWSALLVLLALTLVHVLVSGEAWGALLGLPLLCISLVSRGRWMGWGDGLLEVSVGGFLGLTLGLTALCIAFWSGAILGVVLLLLSKNRYTMKSEVPFAPFLILGAAAAFFFHVDLFSYLPVLF
jgi:prepilin signal peptidase PulO-like enzyme (type II secretory pathway)